MGNSIPRVALVSPGDRATRKTARLDDHRLGRTAEALRAEGMEPLLTIYNDEFAEEVRAQLLGADAALVWVNPIEQERDRSVLDALLRDVADAGVFVSAHPDTILKMGTKEVLHRTRGMSWGCDTRIYVTPAELREALPQSLAGGVARVLKQYRGNGGNGVWKVERVPGDPDQVRIRHAKRGCVEEEVPLAKFLERMNAYFLDGGRIIDQAYQERLVEGMVRCYLAGDQVAGFGHQEINALFPAPAGASPADAPQPGPRLYYPPTDSRFEEIRRKMEEEWLDDLCRTLEMDRRALPVIWDADLLYGPRTALGEDTYVLCEINVSSVYPFPEDALRPMARALKEKL